MYSIDLKQKQNNINSNYRYISGVIAILIIIVVNIRSFEFDKIGKLFDNLSTPNSGEAEVLPIEVQFILKFTKVNHVKTIRMSPDIANNRFIAQPLTESVYPIIINDAAADIYISFVLEKLPFNCTMLESEKRIQIAICS
jgi:hypothetical protein